MRRFWIIFGLSLAICASASGQNNSKNATGKIVGNKGIVTQGQVGNNTITNLHAPKEKAEDLRVSLGIAQAPNSNLKVTYLFRNLGKQAELISAVALVEIVTADGGDAKDKIALCDKVETNTMLALQSPFTAMTGPGVQIGNDAKQTSLYYPVEISVDGQSQSLGRPVTVDGEKSRIVEAIFKFSPDHAKDKKSLVFCPLIQALDIENKPATTICRAQATVRSDSGMVMQTFGGQFKILPQVRPLECREASRTMPPTTHRGR
jgi:hypothetical protein